MIKGAFVPACGGPEAPGGVYGMRLFPCALESKACHAGYQARLLRGAVDTARSSKLPST